MSGERADCVEASFLVSFFILTPIHDPIRNMTADKSFGNIVSTNFSMSGTLNISVNAAQT